MLEWLSKAREIEEDLAYKMKTNWFIIMKNNKPIYLSIIINHFLHSSETGQIVFDSQ